MARYKQKPIATFVHDIVEARNRGELTEFIAVKRITNYVYRHYKLRKPEGMA